MSPTGKGDPRGQGPALPSPALGAAPTQRSVRRYSPSRPAGDLSSEAAIRGCGEVDFAGGSADVLTLGDDRGAHLRLALEQRSRKRYRVSLWVSQEGQAAERLVGHVRLRARSTVQLTVAWRSASSPSSGDGAAILSKNGSVSATAEGLATGSRFANVLKLGLPTGAPPGSSGRLLFDGVSLRR